MFGMSPMEILMVFLIILLLFGAKKLPELARSMGKAVREFKNATDTFQKEFDVNDIDEPRVKKEIPEQKKVDDVQNQQPSETPVEKKD